MSAALAGIYGEMSAKVGRWLLVLLFWSTEDTENTIRTKLKWEKLWIFANIPVSKSSPWSAVPHSTAIMDKNMPVIQSSLDPVGSWSEFPAKPLWPRQLCLRTGKQVSCSKHTFRCHRNEICRTVIVSLSNCLLTAETRYLKERAFNLVLVITVVDVCLRAWCKPAVFHMRCCRRAAHQAKQH